jgi:hypothetical protein
VKAQADEVCDGTADDVQIQAAIDALPSCNVYDGSDSSTPISGKTGEIHFSSGVFRLTSSIVLPAGSLRLQGVAPSSFGSPGISDKPTPYENTGGTIFTMVAGTNPIISNPLDANSVPGTWLWMDGIEFRIIDPASAQSGGVTAAPCAIALFGWIGGDISNINVYDIKSAGGYGVNEYTGINILPSLANYTDKKYLRNVQIFGFHVGIAVGVDSNPEHIVLDNLYLCHQGGTVDAYSAGIFTALTDDQVYQNIEFDAEINAMIIRPSPAITSQIFSNLQFVTCEHYVLINTEPATPVSLIFENPNWMCTVDPRIDLYNMNIAYPNAHIIVRNSTNSSGSWTGIGDVDPPLPVGAYSNPTGSILNLSGHNTEGNSLYTDISGAFNHGVITSGAWLQLTSGIYVPHFNASSTVITVPDPAGEFSPTTFTLNIWVLMDSLTSNPCFASKKNTTYDQANGWILYWDSGDAKLALRTVGGTTYNSGVVSLEVGWHMITVTVAGTNAAFYLDGVAVGTASVTQVVSNADSLYLGRMSNDYPSWLDGKMGKPMFLTGGALTEAQSLVMFNQQLPNFQ